jgi:hypothetical protein
MQNVTRWNWKEKKKDRKDLIEKQKWKMELKKKTGNKKEA